MIVADRHHLWNKQPTLYDSVEIPPTANPAELRLSFKIPQLELRWGGAKKESFSALARAFNILAQPELRACYDALLTNLPQLLVASERAQVHQSSGLGTAQRQPRGADSEPANNE
jgi:DnaJ-class molecular chaperone